jgi:hypothetical protein
LIAGIVLCPFILEHVEHASNFKEFFGDPKHVTQEVVDEKITNFIHGMTFIGGEDLKVLIHACKAAEYFGFTIDSYHFEESKNNLVHIPIH